MQLNSCYHRYNTETVGSDAYIEHLIDKGCLFGWYFTYMPIGKDARPDLLATAAHNSSACRLSYLAFWYKCVLAIAY